MPLDPNIKEAIWYATLFSAFGGAAVVGIFGAFNSWRERASVRKRHLRDLAVQLAFKQWERELAEEEAAKQAAAYDTLGIDKPEIPYSRPLRVIVFEMLRFADDIYDSGLTAETLASHITGTSKVLSEASRQIKSPKK